jgi:hypothetical protein
MSARDLTESAALLRAPFPKSSIGKLPKGGAMLDYVGHAGVTDRLLAVDPEWSWEPLALDEQGLPRYDVKGGLWIRLTICGVTRLGYGDGPDPKQRIGDAIRNAAMRFGVALDLWAKEDLVEFQHVDWLRQQAAASHDTTGAAAASPAPAAPVVIPDEPPVEVVRSTHADPGEWATDSGASGDGEVPGVPDLNVHELASDRRRISAKQVTMLRLRFDEKGIPPASRKRLISDLVGREVETSKDLTNAELTTILEAIDHPVTAEEILQGADLAAAMREARGGAS